MADQLMSGTETPESRDDDPRSSTRSMRHALDEMVPRIESDGRLDEPAAVFGGWADSLASSRLGPVLDGRAIGHALHPLLTDVPIGCWTCAAMLDLLGGRASRPASERLIACGVITAVPTMASGLVELSTVPSSDEGSRRIATAHACLNTAAVGAYAASWLERRRGHRLRGLTWGAIGAVVASASGHLGGHLAFVSGIGRGRRTDVPVPGSASVPGSRTDHAERPATGRTDRR